MDFREATDELFSRVDHEDLADLLGISVASIRQSRLNAMAKAHRSPPQNWGPAVIKLAEHRIRRYERLIEKLAVDADPPSTTPTTNEVEALS
jgi:hypothetical protein